MILASDIDAGDKRRNERQHRARFAHDEQILVRVMQNVGNHAPFDFGFVE